MLARVFEPVFILLVCLCVCVCVSVTRWYCVKTAKRIQLIFGTEPFLGLCYTVFEGNSGISQNKGTCLRDFSPKLDSEKFRHVRRCVIVAECGK